MWVLDVNNVAHDLSGLFALIFDWIVIYIYRKLFNQPFLIVSVHNSWQNKFKPCMGQFDQIRRSRWFKFSAVLVLTFFSERDSAVISLTSAEQHCRSTLIPLTDKPPSLLTAFFTRNTVRHLSDSLQELQTHAVFLTWLYGLVKIRTGNKVIS